MSTRESRRGRGLLGVAAAVALAAATVGVGGASVGADDGPAIPDVPSLGFSIDPSQGEVGSTVDGLVDVDDVAQHCITDPLAFVEQFLGDGSFETGSLVFTFDSPYFAAVSELLADPDVQSDPAMAFAANIALAFPLGLGLDLDDPEGGALVDGAIEATMIMGFADLATASPIAPYGSFDPATGVGSTPVPDIEGGSQIVIATCVGLPDEVSEDDLLAALEVAADYIRENFEEPYPASAVDPEFEEIAGEVAPVILEKLVEPKALGIASFCVDDGEGSCDDDGNGDGNGNGEGPGDNGNGDGSGDGNGNGSGNGSGGGGSASPATPVSGSPTYTG